MRVMMLPHWLLQLPLQPPSLLLLLLPLLLLLLLLLVGLLLQYRDLHVTVTSKGTVPGQQQT